MRITAALFVSVLSLLSGPAMAADSDVIQGKPVIERLDLESLESGKIRHLYFGYFGSVESSRTGSQALPWFRGDLDRGL